VLSFFAQIIAVVVVLAMMLGVPRHEGAAQTDCAWCPAHSDLTSAQSLSSEDAPRDSEERQDHEQESSEGKLLALPRDTWSGYAGNHLVVLLCPHAVGLSAGRAAPVMVFRPPC